MQDTQDTPSTPRPGDLHQAQQDLSLREVEQPTEGAHSPTRPPSSTSSPTSSSVILNSTDSAPNQSPSSSFTSESNTIQFLQFDSSPRIATTPNLEASNEMFNSPLLESAPPSSVQQHSIATSSHIISTGSTDPPHRLLRSPHTPLPLSFGRDQSPPEGRHSTPSFAPERPERRTSRVRWDIPEDWPTDSTFSPAAPGSSFSPSPSVSPSPSTAPTYAGLITPLWTSTPPALRSFPLVAPNPIGTPSPWYHNTPHPLPIFPVFPSMASAGYGPINRTMQAYSDLPGDNRHNPPGSPPPVSQNQHFLPEFTPGTPHMEPHSLPTPGLGAQGPTHSSLGVGQSQYIPQGAYTLSEQIHSRFFLQDGNIDFRVNNVLFRVHRHFFFPNARALLLIGPVLPPVIDLSVFGFSQVEFASFLSLFYPRTIGTYEIHGIQGWTTILKVANVLNFKDIRKLAIQRLDRIAPPVDRIVLSRKYDVQRWVVPAFKELCTSIEPLTNEEGRKLGVEGLMVLTRMKQELQNNLVKYLDSGVIDEMVREMTELDV
ncbi:hypothetical protein D9757_006856 [Collybiopsis confluens]|uniref:BTB domain-containing protein n=1 Tax=Collybiopsis confluens TaxID=2823264 RepID=A0A8H5MB67_9AGAR|nr:hypothetical protein D9757_006856 [Collybiopsis confluens]